MDYTDSEALEYNILAEVAFQHFDNFVEAKFELEFLVLKIRHSLADLEAS